MPLPGNQNTVVMKRVSQGSFLQRSVLKHNVIFTEGSRGDEAYLLVDGKVEISGSVDGRKKVFAVLQPVAGGASGPSHGLRFRSAKASLPLA